MKKSKGITLIALIITVILMLILAGVAISSLTGNGLLSKEKEMRFKAKMSQIAEEWDVKRISNKLDMYSDEKIPVTGKTYAGEVLKDMISDEEIELDELKVQDIKAILNGVKEEEEKYVIIYEDELYYVSQPHISNNKEQTKWCEQIGIKIWKYSPQNSGIKVINGNYEKINGLYMCTPKLNTGFVKEKTRYIKENPEEGKDNLVPGTWINKKPEDD